MGNCQAIDAAALVIQHPDGRIERLYWTVSANEVMRANPGHYVSLIIPLPSPEEEQNLEKQKTVRFTRVKLLRPDDTLALGHAYRLITSQEVLKVLRAKKYKKMKQQQPELAAQMEIAMGTESSGCEATEKPEMEKHSHQGMKHEKNRQKTPTNQVVARPKSWRPSLQSISEAGS